MPALLDLNAPVLLTPAGLSDAMAQAGYPRGANYAADLARLCPLAGLSTPLRLSHFFSQLTIESDRFRAVEEYASGSAYEGRANLGNVRPGDGKRFKGRGLIQLTGRDNYKRFTAAVRDGFGQFPGDPDAPDFTQEPEKVATRPYCVTSALWYWHRAGLAAVSDEGDTVRVCERVSRCVNRGNANAAKPANHEAERIEAFRKFMTPLRRMAPAAP